MIYDKLSKVSIKYLSLFLYFVLAKSGRVFSKEGLCSTFFIFQFNLQLVTDTGRYGI